MAIYRRAYVRIFAIVIIAANILAINSCLAQRKSSMAAEAGSANLVIQGLASSSSGQPIQGADVYLDNIKDMVARTSGDGSFKIEIDAAKFANLQSSIPTSRSTLNIYIKQPGSILLVGASAPISIQQRGTFDAGTVTLHPASSIKGKVLLVAGNLTSSGAGALVSVGREQTTANPDGSFILKELPAGALTLRAEIPKYQTANESITVTSGTDTVRDEPVVLFQGNGPSAILLVQPYVRDPAAKHNATTRSFKVKASPSAKFIRYYHSLTEMERLPTVTTTTNANNNVTVQVNANSMNNAELTQWREIPDIVNYSFPAEGPAALWYQAADEALDKKSDILQVAVNIDSCEGVGIVMGDGSGVTRTRKTSVSLNGTPSNATRVRISEDIAGITTRPWQSIAPSVEFILSAQSSSFGGGSEQSSAQAIRQVFVQIGTTSGECPVMAGSIDLDPFPAQDNMFVINGGNQITPSRIVQIDIPSLPQNAYEMRFAELTPPVISSTSTNNNNAIINSTPWMRALPTSSFMFQGTGTRMLSLQFRDIDGLVSSSYSATIDVVPSQLADFAISFSQISVLTPIIPPPPSRYLVLQLLPPQNALAFRYLEIVSDGSNSNLGGTSTNGFSNGAASDASALMTQPWLNLIPLVPVYARGIGMRTFVMQYLTVDGITTTLTRSIFIDQVPATIGDFVINNGEISTLFPTVQLNVIPPVDGVAMSATNLTLQQTTANSSTVFIQGTTTSTTTVTTNDQWVAIAPSMSFKLDGRGTQTVQIRFRDPNGNVATPAVVHSIIYDPFPPFPVGFTPFTINSGAATTTSALVTLNITAPESTHSFRVSLDPTFVDTTTFQELPTVGKTSISGVPWQVYQFNTPFILTGTAGPKIVYVEFRNELGDRSAAATALINYAPVP